MKNILPREGWGGVDGGSSNAGAGSSNIDGGSVIVKPEDGDGRYIPLV